MFNRILLVAADHSFLHTLAYELNEEWFETVCADDESSAQRLLNETNPELLIAEIALPEKGGYELCRYVRQNPRFRTLPVVLLDSHFDALNESMAFEAGADAYLSKPFEPAELIELVGKLLEGKEGFFLDHPTYTDSITQDRAPMPDSYDSIQTEPGRGADLIPIAPYLSKEQTSGGLQETVPGRAMRARSFILWGALVAAVLAIAGVTTLVSTRTSSVLTIQKQASKVKKAESESFEVARPQSGEISVKQEAGRADAGERQSEANGKLNDASRDRRVTAKRSRPAGRSADVILQSRVVRHWEPPRQYSPAVALVKDSADAEADRYYAPAIYPRNASTARSQTFADDLNSDSQDAKEADKGFGSRAKHLGESGIKAGIWAGKKVGEGAKRLGAVFKKIF